MSDKPAILAFCTTAIGDLMFCTPAIHALADKYQVDVLVHEKRAALLINNPHVRQIYKYRNNGFKRAWLALKLNRRRYQYIAVLHANDDVYKMLPFLRYEQAFNIQGWDIPKRRLKALPRTPYLHNIDRPLLVAQACGAIMPPLEQRKPELYLSAQDIAQAASRLQPGKTDAPLVGLVAGGSFKDKCWPLDRFVRLAKELQAMGANIMLIGSKAERTQAESFVRAGVDNIIYAYDMDLRLLGALIGRLNLLVSNDTGPVHLAHAMEVPCVCLFGLTNPAVIAPRHPQFTVISVFDQLNGFNQHELMAKISYEQVRQAVLEALAAHTPGKKF